MKHLLFTLNKSNLKIAFHQTKKEKYSEPIIDFTAGSIKQVSGYINRKGLSSQKTYVNWVSEASTAPLINYNVDYDLFFQEFISTSLNRYFKKSTSKLQKTFFEVFSQTDVYKILLIVDDFNPSSIKSSLENLEKSIAEQFHLAENIEFKELPCLIEEYQQFIWTTFQKDNRLLIFHEGTTTGKEKVSFFLENNKNLKEDLTLHSYPHPIYAYNELIRYLEGNHLPQVGCIIMDYNEKYYTNKDKKALNQLSESFELPIYFLNSIDKFKQASIVAFQQELNHNNLSYSLLRIGNNGVFQFDQFLFTNKWESYIYKENILSEVLGFFYDSKKNDEANTLLFAPIEYMELLEKIRFKYPALIGYYKQANEQSEFISPSTSFFSSCWINNNLILTSKNENDLQSVCIYFNEVENKKIVKNRMLTICLTILKTYLSFKLTPKEQQLINEIQGGVILNSSKQGLLLRIPSLLA